MCINYWEGVNGMVFCLVRGLERKWEIRDKEGWGGYMQMGTRERVHSLDIFVTHFNSYQKGSTMEMIVKTQGLKMIYPVDKS